MLKNKKVKNAIFIGTLCSVSYLGVYFARNILSAVTPQIIESGQSTTEFIGTLSSIYFAFYAIGQLINGIIGDRVKARYMISFGLILAGVCNFIFPVMLDVPSGAYITYGMTGFFLSMIYAPMTKVVAENTEPIHATRCSLGYTFASFFGSPLAGVAAALLVWQSVFYVSSAILVAMGTICFCCFLVMEKKGLVKYNQYKPQKKGGGNIKILIEHRIVKFTLISIITGVVRTSVVFWMPTYIAQYLGFASDQAASIFTVATFVISMTTFVAVFLYERLKRNMDLTILVVFSSATVFFFLTYLVEIPMLNIAFLVLAIMSSNCAASMLWSRYCPSLRDTGMVSTATGFLDFVSYMAASASSTIFANAVTTIGWKNLILVWLALMVFGVLISIPWKRKMQ
ncbi:MAG: MFS transporter [Tyzzerella sp.]|nr:MFS transporter [Tyzzerella sp.]